MRPHPATDLRLVYPAVGGSTEQERLRALRARRPTLREIAAATRAYHFRGDGDPLRRLIQDG